jgi:hypothetical protein
MENVWAKVKMVRTSRLRGVLISLLTFGPFACTAYLWIHAYNMKQEMDRSHLMIDSLMGANKRLEKELIFREKDLKFYEKKSVQLEKAMFHLSK